MRYDCWRAFRILDMLDRRSISSLSFLLVKHAAFKETPHQINHFPGLFNRSEVLGTSCFSATKWPSRSRHFLGLAEGKKVFLFLDYPFRIVGYFRSWL